MLHQKLRSFRYSMRGLAIAWREEFNFRVHAAATALVLFLSWFLGISAIEFLFVLGAVTLVLAAELFNTALEELCDKFGTDPDPHIAKIKDLAAAAVSVAALGAFVIGSIIFIPYVLALL
ncbi:MAG: diacylglycerol kinase family protein [Candidatus Kaiserbacteria bacterium]|nr:MAG: diacylglycerol kinase family protein [Candidatus Kaiserbacteria bacterium]